MKSGDLVKLRSGGPLMTVIEVHDSITVHREEPTGAELLRPGIVKCAWFGTSTRKLRRGDFREVMLRLVSTAEEQDAAIAELNATKTRTTRSEEP